MIYRDDDDVNLNLKVTIAFVIYKEKADKELVYKLREKGVITTSRELFEES